MSVITIILMPSYDIAGSTGTAFDTKLINPNLLNLGSRLGSFIFDEIPNSRGETSSFSGLTLTYFGVAPQLLKAQRERFQVIGRTGHHTTSQVLLLALALIILFHSSSS